MDDQLTEVTGTEDQPSGNAATEGQPSSDIETESQPSGDAATEGQSSGDAETSQPSGDAATGELGQQQDSQSAGQESIIREKRERKKCRCELLIQAIIVLSK